jgi:ABC-2 type transport system ATP-binding protein
VLVSSHLLADLERVVTHVVFLREGRVQLAGEWDALAEHLRLLVLPEGSSAEPRGAGVLHRRVVRDELRVVADARQVALPPGSGNALNLDDLFAELNS